MKLLCFMSLFMSLSMSCGVKKQVLEEVVRRDAVTFELSELPNALIENIRNHSFVILGETHYVQEYSNFLLQVVKSEYESTDRLVFLQEQPSCFNWLVEDYINGAIDSLPNSLRHLDGHLLDELKQLKSNTAGNSQFQYTYMDVNHGRSFLSSI